MEKIKTKLGSAALFAVMAVIAIKTPLLACYIDEMMPAKTIEDESPFCTLVAGETPHCTGQYMAMHFPPLRDCKWVETGLKECSDFHVQKVCQITTKQCVYNTLQGDCLLGFTDMYNVVRTMLEFSSFGAPCPEPSPEPEE